MAYVYDATGNDGKTYTVNTAKHHDDHDDKTFRAHLLDVIKGTISGVVASHITHYRFKGRR